VFRPGVETNFNPIENANDAGELLVNRFHRRAALLAAADIGLVGHHDEKKAGRLEPRAPGRHVLEDLQFVR
jgi:hypothetical protein